MSDSTPQVLAYTVQADGNDFIIGSPHVGKYVSVPADVLEILRALEAGQSLQRICDDYHQLHGETPDLGDLIAALTSCGILASVQTRNDGSGAASSDMPPTRYHFEWISPSAARLIWNRYTLSLMAAIVAAALLALASQPSLMPGWRAFYFPRDTAAHLLGLMLLGISSTFIHEMAHLTAARAAGVSCRFSIGNMLWFIVWHTDMNGVWALPRKRRYLPILAGPIVDAVSAAAIVLYMAAAESFAWTLSTLARNILSALLFLYIMRIVWQCYFFLRTDFYYAFSNLLGCRSLMQDTEGWLRNRWASLRRRAEAVDQSALPAHERRLLPGYAAIWLTGRAVAFGMLLLVQLPLFVNYLLLLIESVNAPKTGHGPTTSALLAGLMFSAFLLVGLVMWIRELWPRKQG
jgi:putative peptide zinc metalloprotease protein